MTIPFVKGHGLGNDYIVLSEADLPRALTEGAIVRICDRNWGVGSDGILLLTPSTRAALSPSACLNSKRHPSIPPRRQKARRSQRRRLTRTSQIGCADVS